MKAVKLSEKIPVLTVLLTLFVAIFLASQADARKKRGNNPTIQETEHGRILILPEDLSDALEEEFPGYQIPEELTFDEKMLKHYYSRLIGIYPAIAWGDFNKDKRRDYALLLITGETPWGPLVELVIMNGKKRGKFEAFRLGEIYGYKDDYLRFSYGKLYKGDFKKGGWYINWIKKEKNYTIRKS